MSSADSAPETAESTELLV